jgi:hypothetical protein
MSQVVRISRRTVLRGVGSAIALPLLDAMLPPAVGSRFARAVAATEAGSKAPNRMAFLYVPNGQHMPDWTPEKVGPDFDLRPILQPLEKVRSEITVLSGLAQDGARAHQDGPGDHARALASFLTGCHPRKTHGADIKAGVSVDQVAAARVGSRTRLASLELGCDAGAQAGNCDSGYSCAYSTNGSWKSESLPMAKEVNPRLVFERLFTDFATGEGTESQREARRRQRKSVLDFVLDDATRLKARLGASDQRKLDEYLTTVRELEARIVRAEKGAAEGASNVEKPKGIPQDYAEHIRLMCDLIVLAFQGDLTRIVTFIVADEGSNRSYPFIGVAEGHHDLSHHGGDKEKQAKVSKINQFHSSHLAYLLEKLHGSAEGDGNLLDHAMVVYGSAIGDGNAHNHDNLPILLAGRGCGTIRPGRHMRCEKEVPLNNLWLSMLDRMEAPTDKLGDSTGRLTEL